MSNNRLARLTAEAASRLPGSRLRLRGTVEGVRNGLAETSQRVEVEREQAHLDHALKLREERRTSLEGGLITNANANGRGAWETRAPEADALAEFGPPDGATAFGRIDLEGESLYVGRMGIFDEDRDAVVVNWKSPIGGLFYSATALTPGEVTRKRTFRLEDDPTNSYPTNVVVDFTDEVYGELGDEADTELVPGDHLLHELARARSGEMRDIVATIQSHQYALIAATADRPLLIQGGPGTGKTAVALHRVSWLLNDRREAGWRARDVLVVGPSKAFTRYVRNVLPALGDQGVSQIDLAGLAPAGTTVGRLEAGPVAALKGEERMAALLRRAVEARVVPPERPHEIGFATGRVRFSPERLRGYIDEAMPLGYENGRRRFAQLLLDEVNDARGIGTAPAERSVVANLVDKVWPSISPARFLRDLFASEARLTRAAGDEFTAAEVLRLHRRQAERGEADAFSVADAALLDELDFLVGRDRTERFKHVVVDEAQDLTPMQLRAIARRVSNRSITLVGDLAQATGPDPAKSWADITAPFGEVEYAEMTVGYRIPREVSEFTSALVPRIAPALEAPTSIRDSESTSVVLVEADEHLVLEALAAIEGESSDERSEALIVPDELLDEALAVVADAGIPHRMVDDEPSRALTVLTARQAKGLEFDVVCVAEPERIAAGGLSDLRALYVAYTRATQTLIVAHRGDPHAMAVEVEPAVDEIDLRTPPAPESVDELNVGAAEPPLAPPLDRRAMILLGRLAEHGAAEPTMHAAAALARLRLGITTRRAIAEANEAEISATVEAVDDLLDGRGLDLDALALLIAACWCLAELICLHELTHEDQVARRAAAGDVLGRLRSADQLPRAVASDLERALIG